MNLIFIAVNPANASKDIKRLQSGCNINFSELMKLKSEIAKNINEDETMENSCGALILKTINVSSKLRNMLKKKTNEFETLYNEAEIRLKEVEKNLAAPLLSVPGDLKKQYGKIFVNSTNQIKEIRRDIENAIDNGAKITAKLNYYEFHLKSTMESLNNQTNCPLTDEHGAKVISILIEINVAVRGRDLFDNCESLIDAMMSVEFLMSQKREFDEKKLDLLNKYYNERRKIMQKIIDDNNDQTHDFENLKADSQDLTNELNDLILKNKNLQVKIAEKANKFIVKMIREGRNFNAVKEILSEANADAYSNALVDAYNCKENNILNVIRFVEFYDRSGFETVRDKMKACSHMHNPMILKIAHELNDGSLNNSIDAVYNDFANKIQKNKSAEVVDFIKSVSSNIVDLPKLVCLGFNKNMAHMEAVMMFIDGLNVPNKKLEMILYDEMMENGGVDTVEHVMFGFWIMNKITHIENQPNQKNVIDLQKQPLEELKQRLPEGIRFLFFEPYVIFASQNFAYLMRAFGLDSVKFKAIPSNNGRYFLFRDSKDGREIFITSKNNRNIAMVGKGGHQGYYWQIIPTENAKLFYIKSFIGDSYLSSDELQVCAEEETKWYQLTPRCIRHDHYNIAYPNIINEKQKWMITTYLIRNKMLTDRTNRKH